VRAADTMELLNRIDSGDATWRYSTRMNFACTQPVFTAGMLLHLGDEQDMVW